MIKTENDLRLFAKTAERETVKNKITACLYAGALGDALGYAVEFSSWESIKSRYGKNGIREPELTGGKALISDDTQMTLFTAEGMGLGYFRSDAKGISAPTEQYIYFSYLCWYKTQGGNVTSPWEPVSALMKVQGMYERRAPGNTCLTALGSGVMGTVREPINNSKGCGGVMRTAPLGFVRNSQSGNQTFGPALENGAKVAAITHGHPMGFIPAGMLSDIVDRCIYGGYRNLADIINDSLENTKEKYGAYDGFADFEALIKKSVLLAEKNKNSAADSEVDESSIRSLGEGWVGDEALAIAVYAALRHGNNIKDCLRTAVNHSGDSDSTGAIAGNIVGAFYGTDYIPQDWLETLELKDAIDAVSDILKRVVDRCL